jgi:hypothetical protein
MDDILVVIEDVAVVTVEVTGGEVDLSVLVSRAIAISVKSKKPSWLRSLAHELSHLPQSPIKSSPSCNADKAGMRRRNVKNLRSMSELQRTMLMSLQNVKTVKEKRTKKKNEPQEKSSSLKLCVT